VVIKVGVVVVFVNMPKRCKFFCIKCLILFYLPFCVVGWNNDDLELFDLVEEVNQNFYDVLGLSPVRAMCCMRTIDNALL